MADVGVTILMRTQVAQAVVEVPAADALDADVFRQFSDHSRVIRFGADVVAGGENVTGVDANADALGGSQPMDDRTEFGEISSQARALAGGGFQQRHAANVGMLAEDLIQRRRGTFHGNLDRLLARGSGVDDQVRDIKRIAALELFDESAPAFVVEFVARGGEVDQICRVSHDGGDTRRFAQFLPLGQISGFERRRFPLSLVFDENLDGVHLQAEGFPQRVRHAAGDGKMRAKAKLRLTGLMGNWFRAIFASSCHHALSNTGRPKGQSSERIVMNSKSYLILASASPRRRQILTDMGIPFEVCPCELPEPVDRPIDLAPGSWAEALAHFKARPVAESNPGRYVLGADTIVVCEEELLGKPHDLNDARRMLELQAGRETDVITGIALVGPTKLRTRILRHAVTKVWMRDDVIEREAYLQSGDWSGKAGAYGIQTIGDRLVERIEGEFSNVVGLPVELVRRTLIEGGFLRD